MLAQLVKKFLDSSAGARSGIYIALCILVSGFIHWIFIGQFNSRSIALPGLTEAGQSIAFLTSLLFFVGSLSYLFHLFWFWSFRKFGGIKRILSVNIQRLGIFLFFLSLIYGPSITIYLIVCYLAFAPLFTDDNGSIKADNLFVATAFGLLTMGLSFELISPILEEKRIVFVLPFIVLATMNLFTYKHRLIPLTSISSYPYLITVCLLFFAFGGTVLLGSLLMGFGEYPRMFYNMDTPVRLTHAHELIQSTSSPPDMLVLKGHSMPYQYGGPAAAAALSVVTQLAVHKSMFHVALPIILVGCFCAVHLLCRSTLNSRLSRCVSISLFLPFIYLGTELFARLVSVENAGSFINRVVLFGKEFAWLHEYDDEKFTKGIWDISQTTGLFLLITASLFLLKKKHAVVLTCAPLVVLLVASSKLSTLPAVCSLLAVRVFASYKHLGFLKLPIYILAALCVVILGLHNLSVFQWATGNEAEAVNLIYHLSHFVEAVSGRQYILVESVFVIFFSGFLLIFFLVQSKDSRDNKTLLLFLGSLACLVACFFSVTTIEVLSKYQLYQPVWICLPLICTGMLFVSSRASLSRTICFVLIGPVLIVALLGGWVKLQQFYLLVVTQGRTGHEYVDNRPMGQALRHIPKADSQVVTNNFVYFGRPNLYQMTALFGHQAYSVDAKHLRHNSSLLNIARKRIREQELALEPLGNHFYTESDAKKITSISGDKEWTHILYKKHKSTFEFFSPVFTSHGTEGYAIGDSVSIKQISNYEADLVNCTTGGRTPDGVEDKVFDVAIRLPNHLITSNPVISSITLYQKNPERRFHTDKQRTIDGYNYSTLGVALNNELVLVNNEEGEIRIPVVTEVSKLLLFTCAGLGDSFDSEYVVKTDLTFPSNTFVFTSPGDEHLNKTFENQSYKVYELH